MNRKGGIVNATMLAIVTKIVEQHMRQGPYAIAVVIKGTINGSITFSLQNNVWKEQSLPKPGTEVYLSQLIKTRKGWRAHEARFSQPADSL
jgi:hypothetical protein